MSVFACRLNGIFDDVNLTSSPLDDIAVLG